MTLSTPILTPATGTAALHADSAGYRRWLTHFRPRPGMRRGGWCCCLFDAATPHLP